MPTSRDVVADSADRLRRSLMVLGCSVAVLVLVELLLLRRVGPDVVTTGPFLVGLLTTIPIVAGITYAGYWLDESELSRARYPRITGWCLAGLLVFLALNAAIAATAAPAEWTLTVAWLRWAATLGAGVGLLVGVVEARAIERAIAAERAELRSEHLERHRDLLEYLNGVLRHEVLNSATAIDGYATRVLEEKSDLDPETRRWLHIVLDEADELSRVIDDVRAMLEQTTGGHELRRVDLACVLREEVRKLTTRWPSVEVESSIPDDLTVRADDVLPRVFANVLANAVEHNDAQTPRVTVDVEPTADRVAVVISDNGPGVPEEEVDSLFERGSNHATTHGLGLYLVSELVQGYGGAVELVETGPDGSTFRVELPRVPPDREPASEAVAV